MIEAARRRLCGGVFELPAHLKQSFYTPTAGGRCMIIGNPFWKYPIALVPPEPSVAPLITAIRELDSGKRPFRIVSHEDESGRVFNASFFDDEPAMRAFLEWYGTNALDPAGEFHACLTPAAAESDALPTAGTLLFGAGTSVLADTRFGEYQVRRRAAGSPHAHRWTRVSLAAHARAPCAAAQLGMAVRYSRQTLRSAAMRADAAEEVASAEFEQRIAECMQAHGVAYFGRLIMSEAHGAGEDGGTFLTAVRYGSLDDAQRGSALAREMLAPEIGRWFSQTSQIIGTASRVLEI